MFNLPFRSVLYVGMMLAIIVSPRIFGQDQQTDPAILYRQTMERFEKGDFRTALSGFRTLKENQPGNPVLGYYTGRCLVELNEALDDAIELLYGASKQQVPPDVNLYLGMAYHRDYNFSEAIRYYNRYELEASRQEVKDHRVKQLISTCRSAMEITSTYNQYEVMTVTFIDLSDSLQFSQIRMKGGQLRRKPAEYFRMGEDREGLSSLMFMPDNPLRGDYIYYSGYNRSGKDGKQLFRVKRGTGGNWNDPEEVKSLNTEGDELLPYFDPIESDLYFASDGGAGIGGFDLYKSHYDLERDQWTDPINLGFPINSVMDEYLLLPGSDLGMVMFFSTRQGTDSTVTVYRVHLVEPKKKTAGNDSRRLKEIANLGDVAAEILAEIESISDQGTYTAKGGPGGTLSKPAAERTAPVITPVKILSESREPEIPPPAGKSAYQEILARALMHQAASDSLKDLATHARIKVRESDDPNDRWVWQKQIMVWEKKAQDEEALADELYAQMEDGRTPARTFAGPAVNIPETIEVDTLMDELTVYRFKETRQDLAGEPGTQPPVGSVMVPEASGRINRFDILGESPYNENNPIPVDVSLPPGVFYRIQLGAYGNALEPGAFQGISPITAETIPERGLIKYYAGKFSRYEDASAALSRIRSSGYEDAFIVSWYNGNPISTQKAKQLE
jgi:tetratricopeptide (TPR) repeat protein